MIAVVIPEMLGRLRLVLHISHLKEDCHVCKDVEALVRFAWIEFHFNSVF